MFVAVLTLLALEGMVRVWGYSAHQIYDPIYTPFEKGADLPYVHKPNLRHARGRGQAIIDTDGLGLRTTDAASPPGVKPPGEYRIAIAGDSVTFGEGVPRTEDTFAQILEKTLNQQGQAVRAKVFNFGVSGYSVREMTATLEHRMPEVRPDLVLMAIIPDDLDLVRTPGVNSAGYLTGRPLFRFAAPERLIGRVLQQAHLTYVLRDALSRWIPAPAGLAGSRRTGAESRDSYRYILRFKEAAERRGLSYAIVLLPPMHQTPWGTLAERLKRDRVSHIDLSLLDREFTDRQYRASRFDAHPSPAVHRRIGETLADEVGGRFLRVTRAPTK